MVRNRERVICVSLFVAFLVASSVVTADDLVKAELVEIVQGCVVGVSGRVRITNNMEDFWIKVQVDVDFKNPSGAPQTCSGGGCGSGNCECTASGTIVVPPGTVRFVTCQFTTCNGCDDCDNDSGDCPFGENAFCTEIDSVNAVKIVAYSCDGTSYTTLSAQNHVPITPVTVSPCPS